MRIWNYCLLGLLIVLVLLVSCGKSNQKKYSFFVAGHVYGAPGTNNNGVHSPFKEELGTMRQRGYDFGFFTGDIVREGTDQSWDGIDQDVKTANVPVYFAVGNHDMTNRPLFEKRYGQTFYSFVENNDLFIVLDGNSHGWNIEGEQMRFFEESIVANRNVNNIFIFVHQVIWWWGGPEKYATLRLNSHEGKSKILTYWSDLHPILKRTNKRVYVFAGDIGAADWSDDFMMGSEDNVTFVASGMGSGKGDNYVSVTVVGTSVSITAIMLDGSEPVKMPSDTFVVFSK